MGPRPNHVCVRKEDSFIPGDEGMGLWPHAQALLEIHKSFLNETSATQRAFEKILLDSSGGDLRFALRRYTRGQTVVDSGNSADAFLTAHPAFTYSHIPLGLILSGSLTVYEDGVGVRHLKTGDCVGVFETAHWLNVSIARRIGAWTLVADGDLSILYIGGTALMDMESDTFAEFRAFILDLARTDHVPQPTTHLPLLDWTAAHINQDLLADTAIMIHSHLLPTNIALIRHLAHLAGKRNVFVLEKPYSTIRACLNEVVRAGVDVTEIALKKDDGYRDVLERGIAILWRKVTEAYANRAFKNLLILDDGGDIWATIPWQDMPGLRISGVEQTQRGISRFRKTRMPLPPIVSVASSGVKKIVESAFIADAILEKLRTDYGLDASRTVGVIGMGSIGQNLFNALKEDGYSALCYDAQKPESAAAEDFRNSVDALIQDADILLGATGTDILRGVTLGKISGHKTFASCSSANIEFRTLLRMARRGQNALADRTLRPHDALRCTILNGGFPVNFDRRHEWEAAQDIALTRCLLYLGIGQALALLDIPTGTDNFYALDVHAQEKILQRWVAMKTANGDNISAAMPAVEKVARTIFAEGLKTMPTIWQD
jgi:S-adenosylhomocysteine hydrolase